MPVGMTMGPTLRIGWQSAMRIRLKGVNAVTKTLADGSTRTYRYAWKGGPALRGEPGAPEFVHSYNEAIASRAITPHAVILSILQGDPASEDFRGLAASTRRSYVALIKRIEKDFGDFPLSGLTDRRTRGIFMDWRDRLAAKLWTQAGRLCLERARPCTVVGA